MKYYWLRYTDNMDENFAGITRAFVISIRPKYKDDKGLLEHELYHVACFWKYGIIGRLLYKFSKKWRLNEEVAAYKEQLKYEPATSNPGYYRDMYAGYIADDYGLDISKGEVLLLLK